MERGSFSCIHNGIPLVPPRPLTRLLNLTNCSSETVELHEGPWYPTPLMGGVKRWHSFSLLAVGMNSDTAIEHSPGVGHEFYKYICKCTHMHIYAPTHTDTQTHVHIYMQVHIYIHRCTHIYTCTCIHIHKHAHICTHAHTRKHVHTCTYIHTCTHVHTLAWTHAHTYTHTCTDTQTHPIFNLLKSQLSLTCMWGNRQRKGQVMYSAQGDTVREAWTWDVACVLSSAPMTLCPSPPAVAE